MTDDAVRVLLVDDNADFRAGLHAMLEGAPGIEVCGEAANGAEVGPLVDRLSPDIVLMDLQMPVMNGLDATRALTAARPHIGVIVLTMFEDDDSVFAALRAGARGYLLKGSRRGDTLRAITAVANGEAIFSPSVARRMMGYFHAPRPSADAFPELTDREREVLELVAKGRENGQIAEQLGLSLKTVRNHVSNVLNKLQVADRAQAALRAREAGLG